MFQIRRRWLPSVAVMTVLTLLGGVPGMTVAPAQEAGPPPDKTVKLDQYGDALPTGALQRFGSKRFRVDGQVEAIAFAPGGKMVAASDSHGFVHLFETSTGKELRKLPCDGPGPGLAFSPDGSILVARNTRGEGNIWDTKTWKTAVTFDQYVKGEIRPSPLFFMPGGKELIWSTRRAKGGEVVELVEAATGKLVRTLAETESPPQFAGLAVDTDRKLLAVAVLDEQGMFGKVRLYNIGTGKSLWESAQFSLNNIGSWALSPPVFAQDGKSIFIGGDAKIIVLSTENGKAQKEIPYKQKFARVLGAVPGGAALVVYASVKDRGKVSFLDLTTEKLQQGIDIDANVPWAVTPDGKTLAVGNGANLSLWEVSSGKRLSTAGVGSEAMAKTATFSGDGCLLATGDGAGAVRVWQSEDGKSISTFLPAAPVKALALSRSGELMAVEYFNSESKLSLLKTATGKNSQNLLGGKGPNLVQTMAFAADGKQMHAVLKHVPEVKPPMPGPGMAGNYSWVALTWDTTSGKLLSETKVEEHTFPNLTDDGSTLVCVTNDNAPGKGVKGQYITSINLKAGKKTGVYSSGLELWLNELLVSTDGQLAAGKGEEGFFGLWEIGSGKMIRQYGLDHRRITALAVAPSGRLVATADVQDDDESIWDEWPAKAKKLGWITPPKLPGLVTIRVWDVTTGKEVRTFADVESQVAALAFAPDGKRLASTMANGSVLIWDTAATGKPAVLAEKELQELWKQMAAFDPAEAYPALGKLAGSGAATVAFVGKRLKDIVPVTKADAAKLLKALDSENYTERTKATQDIVEFREFFETALWEALQHPTSLEMHLRLQKILSEPYPKKSPTGLRGQRVVQVLQWIGTPEARKVLADIADRAGNTTVGTQAQAAIKRLDAAK